MNASHGVRAISYLVNQVMCLKLHLERFFLHVHPAICLRVECGPSSFKKMHKMSNKRKIKISFLDAPTFS